LTNKEAREMVKKIGGFEEKSNPPFPTHGKAAFYNPKTGTWISADQDVHNGGVWKVYKGNERIGTFNADLSEKVNK
jgi:hypothetical protein